MATTSDHNTSEAPLASDESEQEEAVREVYESFADAPPLYRLGHHVLVEAVKPR
ncbi:uncharacterized protein SOCEGT47_050220 [Sorangium cellulosum]|uniref:Uncharacterized protein n=1 Tax=Sorangium cellulosum TaxID=56 RepID=A0A4P2Q4Z8_SORCE|nr:hypothetical protein [Sorangium cellulosum]AUX24484.1 uncharacterized protein SOCEGT47_050220 [Sorangium cellulosum]